MNNSTSYLPAETTIKNLPKLVSSICDYTYTNNELIEFAKKCNPEKIVLMHSDNREALIEPLKDVAEIYAPKTSEIVEL